MPKDEEIVKLEQRIAYLEALLERIEKHPHCEGGCIYSGQIHIGTVHQKVTWAGQALGHTCAAKIAAERHEK